LSVKLVMIPSLFWVMRSHRRLYSTPVIYLVHNRGQKREAATRFGMLVHGQPTYTILVGLTVIVAVIGAVVAWRERMTRHAVRRSIGLVGALVWLALIGWLAPSVAVQPALAAMQSTASVTVTESAASDLSESLDCSVLSISGSEDGLSTPAKIRSTKRLLPGDARYVTIPGAVHAYFGDYGPQSGDGQPTSDRDGARASISAAAVRFMDAGVR
jgi:pimeloyl-ACP methyl ester carboxylesterase